MGDKSKAFESKKAENNFLSSKLYDCLFKRYYKKFCKKSEVISTEKIEENLNKTKKTSIYDKVGNPVIFSYFSTLLLSSLVPNVAENFGELMPFAWVASGIPIACSAGFLATKYFDAKETILQAKFDAATTYNESLENNSPEPEL